MLTCRITSRVVDALEPEGLAWDAEAKGLPVRHSRAAEIPLLETKTGTRHWCVSIGCHASPGTVEKTREETVRIPGEKTAAYDPPSAGEETERDPTISELCGRCLFETCAAN